MTSPSSETFATADHERRPGEVRKNSYLNTLILKLTPCREHIRRLPYA